MDRGIRIITQRCRNLDVSIQILAKRNKAHRGLLRCRHIQKPETKPEKRNEQILVRKSVLQESIDQSFGRWERFTMWKAWQGFQVCLQPSSERIGRGRGYNSCSRGKCGRHPHARH